MSNGRIYYYILVNQMQQAQKHLYASKGQDWQTVRKPLWDASLQLEKRVDAEITRGDAWLAQNSQPNLFNQ